MSTLISVIEASADQGSSAGASPAQATVSVIICAYTLDRWDDLVRAVTSVQEQTFPAREIIVVSDHNPQLLELMKATWTGTVAPKVVTLENRQAGGASGARNTAVAAAKGDILAFLDDDAVADRSWLARHMAVYDDPQVLGAGGAIVPRWAAGRPRWFPEEFDWVVGCTYRGLPEARGPQRNLIGANMSLRREIFDAAGYFDTGIGGQIGTVTLGCEETELCIRGTQKLPGRVYLYEPGACVDHVVPKRRATWRYFAARCYREGLSKAQVSQLVGAGAGLASERQHALRTLPAGVLRNLRQAVAERDLGGLERAGAILLGLGITAAGYARGFLAQRLGRAPAAMSSAQSQA